VGGRRVAGLAVAACSALVLVSAALGAPRSTQWRTWWGNASFGASGVTLSSAAPTTPAETHSALVTTRQTWTNPTISFTTTTLAQLRTGSAPNPWEVGWVMFRFRDLSDYYYFILKTNGYELGKKQGSDSQVFLVTGGLPALTVGAARHVQVQVDGPRIRVSVDGTQVVDFTDPHPLAGAGSVGLYEEDSQVAFTSVATSGT
jgi:hypothetical protein